MIENTPALQAQTINHTKPRLWVETLWLLDSLTTQQPLREISLQRGLNLIVSPPGAGNSGHGVGKTAFCQLLRFVLDDPLWSSGSSLRDELLQNPELKEGAVAARVHVGGEAWTVLKPWRNQKLYRASRTAHWQQLAADEANKEFSAYQAALQRHLVEILPIQELPASKQAIEWHQILAWCSRDQSVHYRNYYQWREGGVGFRQPTKSPAALAQIVLGLLHDATTLHHLDGMTKEIADQKSQLQTLREKSAHLLTHVRRQLTRLLDAPIGAPFRQNNLLDDPNLINIAKQRYDFYQKMLRTIEADRQTLDADRLAWVEKRTPLKSNIDRLTNEIGQIEAFIDGDIERAKNLQDEASALQKQLFNHCDAGHLLLRDCQYVTQRIELIQFDRKQRIDHHQRSKEVLESDLLPLHNRLDALKPEVENIDGILRNIHQQDIDLISRHVQTLSDTQLLNAAIEDYEHYESVASGRSSSADIEAMEQKLDATRRRHAQLQLQLEQERGALQLRRRTLGDAMQAVAESLPSFHWGVFNDDEKYRHHPFQLGPPHSTTFKVLEILAGDVACLLDSTRGESFHPGFLLHDSPREAEMSEAILWSLLGHVASSGSDSFQYIVTTSTEPTEALKPFERLRLSSDGVSNLLFSKRLDADQASLA